MTFLSHGFYKTETDVQTGDFGCSTICVADEHGITFFGHNYDWEECGSMIVHTIPEDGYESISTCCLGFLGFGEAYAPDSSMMAGDKEATHQQTERCDLITITAIRLLV